MERSPIGAAGADDAVAHDSFRPPRSVGSCGNSIGGRRTAGGAHSRARTIRPRSSDAAARARKRASRRERRAWAACAHSRTRARRASLTYPSGLNRACVVLRDRTNETPPRGPGRVRIARLDWFNLRRRETARPARLRPRRARVAGRKRGASSLHQSDFRSTRLKVVPTKPDRNRTAQLTSRIHFVEAKTKPAKD